MFSRLAVLSFSALSLLTVSVASAQTVPPPAAAPVPPPAAAPAATLPPATTPPPAEIAPTTPPAADPNGPGPAVYVAPAPVVAPQVTATAGLGGAGPSLKGISFWGILPWSGIGVGGRFMLPLPGIKPLLVNTNLRDSFALEFGADLLHWSWDYPGLGYQYSWTEVIPVGGVMWNIWFNDQLALYPKIEIGYGIGWYSGLQNGAYYASRNSLFVDGAAGVLYKLNNGLTLRAEAGYAGLKLGAGWLF